MINDQTAVSIRLPFADIPSEPESLLATFVTGALEQLDLARGLVFISDHGDLSCRIARDADGRDIPPAERRVPDQLLRHALERGLPVLSLGVRDDPAVSYEGSVAEMSVEAYAAVPVSSRDGLQVVAYFDGPPPRRDVRAALQGLAPVFEDFGLLLDRARRVEKRTERAEAILSSVGGDDGPILGASRAVFDLRRLIQTVAPTDASVLVLGENGTGKELVARELHARSHRSAAPMLSRSCAALTESLLESELFGHEKGAYTGAARLKHGLFEIADRGTIFLDEIGELTPALQVKLLRVIETGVFRRVGGTADIKVDVRLITATNRSLEEMMRSGEFREDLYYRLNVFSIHIPPLRERKVDISLLVDHFIKNSSIVPKRQSRLTPEAMRVLQNYPWPGNARELQNVIERALILCDGATVDPDHLPMGIRVRPDFQGEEASDQLPTLDDVEKRYIRQVLDQCKGHRQKASEILGISERNLYRKLKELEPAHEA